MNHEEEYSSNIHSFEICDTLDKEKVKELQADAKEDKINYEKELVYDATLHLDDGRVQFVTLFMESFRYH